MSDLQLHAAEIGTARGDVKATTDAVVEQELSCAQQLARFFPQTVAVRIPVQVIAKRSPKAVLRDATLLEFSDSEHAIFVSTLPLEFNDKVRLERHRSNSAEATVVAVQYHQGRKAVAVRFDQRPCEWVMQP